MHAWRRETEQVTEQVMCDHVARRWANADVDAERQEHVELQADIAREAQLEESNAEARRRASSPAAPGAAQIAAKAAALAHQVAEKARADTRKWRISQHGRSAQGRARSELGAHPTRGDGEEALRGAQAERGRRPGPRRRRAGARTPC